MRPHVVEIDQPSVAVVLLGSTRARRGELELGHVAVHALVPAVVLRLGWARANQLDAEGHQPGRELCEPTARLGANERRAVSHWIARSERLLSLRTARCINCSFKVRRRDLRFLRVEIDQPEAIGRDEAPDRAGAVSGKGDRTVPPDDEAGRLQDAPLLLEEGAGPGRNSLGSSPQATGNASPKRSMVPLAWSGRSTEPATTAAFRAANSAIDFWNSADC